MASASAVGVRAFGPGSGGGSQPAALRLTVRVGAGRQLGIGPGLRLGTLKPPERRPPAPARRTVTFARPGAGRQPQPAGRPPWKEEQGHGPPSPRPPRPQSWSPVLRDPPRGHGGGGCRAAAAGVPVGLGRAAAAGSLPPPEAVAEAAAAGHGREGRRGGAVVEVVDWTLDQASRLLGRDVATSSDSPRGVRIRQNPRAGQGGALSAPRSSSSARPGAAASESFSPALRTG